MAWPLDETLGVVQGMLVVDGLTFTTWSSVSRARTSVQSSSHTFPVKINLLSLILF